MTISNLIYQLSVYSVIIPFISGIFILKILDKSSKIVLLLLAFATFSQIASVYFSKSIINSFYNLYTVIDISFWAFLFISNIKLKYLKLLGLIIYTTQLSVALVYFYSSGIGYRFYNELVCIDNIVQVFWVLILFYEMYKGEEIIKLESRPIFWFCIGILEYSPCTYFLFAFYHRIHITKADENLWGLHSGLNIILYLLFAVGIWANYYNKKNGLIDVR